MPRVYLSLGSNCRREASLAAALSRLEQAFGPLSVSPVYESEAADAPGAPYLNLVVSLETVLPVLPLKAKLRGIEALIGRERGRPDVVIDIDILLYGDACGDFEGLRLPRPELLERAYVLKPLADLAGQERHPLTGRCYADHWQSFTGSAVLHAAAWQGTHHA
ncbi:MAG TPA: 2-amino-4-hydroxy-6-hydroxymethyldihydropteridine diphosphokinase [Fluviicoccus sp.]|nr:2-amino-4-hydroxy-6-hydroxymethyldihydropteridine diphosphokinase [Fluviicoccus sp.]